MIDFARSKKRKDIIMSDIIEQEYVTPE